MTEAELLAAHPRLYHMAEDGSWESIRVRGLLSTQGLLDLYQIGGDRRVELMRARRPQSVTISRAGFPDAVIRDQKPMNDGALLKCLQDGLTPADWYEVLNTKSFFWVTQQRLRDLLGARAYRNKPHTILTLDTASVLAVHRDNIRLARINSGATLYVPAPRGLSTFRSIADFPKTTKVVELVIEGGVPDAANHAVIVHRAADGAFQVLWRSPTALPEDELG